MIDFTYNVPTKVFFGKDKENQVGEILKGYNFSKVLIVVGKGSVEKSGLLRRILNNLDACEIKYELYIDNLKEDYDALVAFNCLEG